MLPTVKTLGSAKPCIAKGAVRRCRNAVAHIAQKDAPVTTSPVHDNAASQAADRLQLRPDTQQQENFGDKAGLSLGPIGLTVSSVSKLEGVTEAELNAMVAEEKKSYKSIHSMTTAEWREKYEKDGLVDLWVEEEFNAGSRLVGGRAVHRGELYGQLTGEGPSLGTAPVHAVKIYDHRHNQVVDVDVPEDRYILWEAEDAGLKLPYACRMGCCTACAVRVKSGTMWQPEALGISRGLKEQGFALMCVGFPTSDCVLETVEEDEIYDKQFGDIFADQATRPGGASVVRDDFALELAAMDE